MRLLSAALVVTVLGFAGAAFAQPASPLPAQAQPPGSPKADQAKSNPDADAALAVAVRMQKEQQERIDRVLCASGDTTRCPQPEKAPTTPKTPSP